MIWMFLLIAVAVLALLWVLSLRCRSGHKSFEELSRWRYAHRGLHQKPEIPENSMAAFRRAAEAGFGAELDVHLMRDGNLAVIHDSSLLRTAGVDVAIEDLTLADLDQYRLEGTEERIPLLEDVLPLFQGRGALIVELKAERGNHAALSKAVMERLDGSGVAFCVESFDPRVLIWFRRNRPDVCRGQLAENFLVTQDTKLPWILRAILTNLLANGMTRPDFVAYRFEDRRNGSRRLCQKLWKPQPVAWTLRSQEELDQAEREGWLCIFEQFLPK